MKQRDKIYFTPEISGLPGGRERREKNGSLSAKPGELAGLSVVRQNSGKYILCMIVKVIDWQINFAVLVHTPLPLVGPEV